MERIIGQLIEGFGTRALALAGAVTVAVSASGFIADTFQGLSELLAAL